MPKRKLTTTLGSLHPLSKPLKDLLENDATLRKQCLARRETLLMPGKRPDEVHYLYCGLCKFFWKNEDNEEEIFHFGDEDSFLVLDEFCQRRKF